MKKILIPAIICIAALCSCQNAGNNAEGGNYLSAILGYVEDSFGPNYDKADHCIPFAVVVASDEADPEDIRVWGDFWIDNYMQEGDTLKSVSGGSYPGLMHLCKTDGGYEVTKFEGVADGSGFIPTAKAIFGEHFDDFISANADDDARKAAREAAIADYVAAKQLPVTLYQDYGWDPVSIPLK